MTRSRSRFGSRLVIFSVLLALGVVATLAGMRIRERLEPLPVEPEPPIAVETMVVAPQGFVADRAFTGTIESRQRVLLSARISAMIVSLPYREGERVQAGDLLVKLDDRELADEIRRLIETGRRIEADTDFWRRQSERDETLFKSGTITQRRRDETRRTLASYEASLRENRNAIAIAKTRLSYSEIHSPFDGVVQSTRVLPGEMAIPGQALLEVVSLGSMKAVIPIPQSDLDLLRPGILAELSIPALNLTWDAEVDRIYPALDAATRTATLEISLDDMPPEIQPGLQVNARLMLARLDQVLTIPASAIRKRKGEAGIFLVGADSNAVWRPVTAGISSKGIVVVRSGLLEGDEVIVTPDPRLVEGKAVWTVSDRRDSK